MSPLEATDLRSPSTCAGGNPKKGEERMDGGEPLYSRSKHRRGGREPLDEASRRNSISPLEMASGLPRRQCPQRDASAENDRQPGPIAGDRSHRCAEGGADASSQADEGSAALLPRGVHFHCIGAMSARQLRSPPGARRKSTIMRRAHSFSMVVCPVDGTSISSTSLRPAAAISP